jgi:hypothetical protein
MPKWDTMPMHFHRVIVFQGSHLLFFRLSLVGFILCCEVAAGVLGYPVAPIPVETLIVIAV